MCGFVGIASVRDCAGDVLLALQALQHRGQDSAGVGALGSGIFPLAKRLGLVSQGFSAEDLRHLPGRVVLGHVRYPTVGKGVLADTQPFFYRQPGVLMAHNGNFMNVPAMREELLQDSIHLLSRCDVEPVLCLFARELMRLRRREHSVADAVTSLRLCFEKARGAYALAAGLVLEGKETLLALRGPHGIRPAVWGSRGQDWVVASESVALDILGARRQGDVEPGEMLVLRAGEAPQRLRVWEARPAPCVFEYIYFARPDSIMNGESVYTVRRSLGEYLAKAVRAKGIQADVVVPIPDTSRPAAGALAEALAIPYREGFIKNRYTGRTFIMASQTERQNALKMKLNPIRSEFEGRRVLVVDDSIVRGTTLNHTIQLIREQGATQVHLAIYSPPVMYPCYYGIDMSTREELAAARLLPDHTRGPLDKQQLRELEARFAARLGLDSLTYLPIAGLRSAFDRSQCAACFDGEYPLPPTAEERGWIEADRRACDQRELPL